MRGKLNSGDHKMAQDKQAEIVRWLHSVAAASPVPPEEISDRGLTSSPNHPLYSQHKHTDKSGPTAKPDLPTRCRVLARPRVSSLGNVLAPQKRLQSHRPIPSPRERQKSLSPLPDPTQHSELPLFVLEKDTELTENQRPRPLVTLPGTPSKPKLPLTSTYSLDRRPISLDHRPISSNVAAHRRTMTQPQQESSEAKSSPRTLIKQKISLSDEYLAAVEASSHDSSSELSTDRGRSRSPVYNITPRHSEDEGSNPPPVASGVSMELCHEKAVLQPQMLLLRGRTEEFEKETDITSESRPSGRVSPAPVQQHTASGLSKQKLQLLQKMQSFTFDDEGEELFTTSQKKRFLSKKWSPHSDSPSPRSLHPQRQSLSDYSGSASTSISAGSSDTRRTPSHALVGQTSGPAISAGSSHALTRPLSPLYRLVEEPSSSQREDRSKWSQRVEQDKDRVCRQDSGIGTISTNFDVI